MRVRINGHLRTRSSLIQGRLTRRLSGPLKSEAAQPQAVGRTG